MSANGRVKPDVVILDGKEEKHPKGDCYIEWGDGGKRIRLSVGKTLLMPLPYGCATKLS